MLSRFFKYAANTCEVCLYYEYFEAEPEKMVQLDTGEKRVVPAVHHHVCRYNTFAEARKKRYDNYSEKEATKVYQTREYDIILTNLKPCDKFTI